MTCLLLIDVFVACNLFTLILLTFKFSLILWILNLQHKKKRLNYVMAMHDKHWKTEDQHKNNRKKKYAMGNFMFWRHLCGRNMIVWVSIALLRYYIALGNGVCGYKICCVYFIVIILLFSLFRRAILRKYTFALAGNETFHWFQYMPRR